MKILCISDTHTKHRQIPKEQLLEADCIVHAGDISNVGDLEDTKDFLDWFSNLNYKYKIFIAGNHDFNFQESDFRYKDTMGLLKLYSDVIYLCDSEIIIEGLKFYGSPWQPAFFDWAFNLQRGEEINEKWKLIPEDTNVLITHGPIQGILDKTKGGQYVGCKDLKEKVYSLLGILKLHVCGHIHEAYGQSKCTYDYDKEGHHYVNASILDEKYRVVNKPILIEIK
jgi:Icc-related predicted phosphoesterase